MASINNAGIRGFMDLFTEFPYLPEYKSGKAYFKEDEVYYELNFYQSLKDGNFSIPTNTEDWKLIRESIDNYIQDSQIVRAMGEAKINFNPNLFDEDEDALLLFYYLTAHYLVIDLNNSANPLGMGFNGLTQSKSVGSVSESYGIPQWVMNDKTLSLYAQTGYGRKYLSLLTPFLTGNIILTQGRTTCG